MARYRTRQQHGLTPMLRGTVGVPLDGPVADALAVWRDDLVRDLGGPDALSAQQSTLVELAVRVRWMLDQCDGWLFAQPSIINKRKRELWPLVKARMALADSLARLLGQLGLERRAADCDSLEAYIARKAGGDQ